MIAGWVLKSGATVTLEGATVMVPKAAAPWFVELMRKQRAQLARSHPELGWKKRAGLLAGLVTTYQEIAVAQAAIEDIGRGEGVAIPTKLREAIQTEVLAQMRRWIDEKTPALHDRSPREAVRDARGRSAVAEMLGAQQEAIDANPHTAGIDLGEIWNALGLRRGGD